MADIISKKDAAAFSEGFRRGNSKGTGLEGIVDKITSLITELASNYSDLLKPVSDAIGDILQGGPDSQKPTSIKEAVDRYITLPAKTDGTGGMGAQAGQGTILGGGY